MGSQARYLSLTYMYEMDTLIRTKASCAGRSLFGANGEEAGNCRDLGAQSR